MDLQVVVDPFGEVWLENEGDAKEGELRLYPSVFRSRGLCLPSTSWLMKIPRRETDTLTA